jgi:LysM repeat protein
MNEKDQLSMFSEGEPTPRKEKMKVSKVVLIVVALHVLVIGGFLLFEAFNRETPAQQTLLSDNESIPSETAGTSPDINPPVPSLDNLTPAAPTALPAVTSLPSDPMTTPPLATVTPPPAPVARTYTVKSGDSLWKIAKTEGVKMEELAQLNNWSKTKPLQVGQVLQLPAATTAEPVNIATGGIAPSGGSSLLTADASASPDLYVVKSGDSLWKIAKNHGTSVASIKQANQLTSDSLKIGQKLRMPSSTPATAAAPATASIVTPSTPATPGALTAPVVSSAAKWNPSSFRDPGEYRENGKLIYALGDNETLGSVAQHYNVRVADLMRVNGITNPTLVSYGNTLVIPETQSAAMLTQPATP